MIEIVTDSSAQFTAEEARQLGFHTVPLQILADGRTYRDLETLDAAKMARICRQGIRVSSSQPAIGEILELYDRLLADPEAEILDLTMTASLSGTWQTACSARSLCTAPERVTVLDTRSLAGPHRSMVLKALEMRDGGHSVQEICQVLGQAREVSTVTVCDMKFLENGGRLKKGLGAAGQFLHILPTVLKDNASGELRLCGCSRSWKKVFERAEARFLQAGLDESWKLWILHGDSRETACRARDWFASRHPDLDIEIRPLSPLFMVHGGPGCLALQAVRI